MKPDRPTIIAALGTLAAATPVYLVVQVLFAAPHQPSLPRAFEEKRPASAAPPATNAIIASLESAPELQNRSTDSVEVQPRPAPQVSGTLKTPDGTPIPGEVVELTSWALATSYSGTSDAKGRFSLSDVAPALDYEVHVESEGRYRDHVQRDLVVTAEGITLNLTLEPLGGARLGGRMVDADGAPLPGRTLLLQGSHAPTQMLAITGDDRGSFRIDNAPTGQLIFSTGSIPHLKVRGPLLSPASEADVLLVLDEGTHELGGRIVGDREVPVAGAQLKLSWSYRQGGSISSSSRTAVTDPSGAFRFTDLGPGPHQLMVYAAGYEDASETYAVSWNTGDVELRLTPSIR